MCVALKKKKNTSKTLKRTHLIIIIYMDTTYDYW